MQKICSKCGVSKPWSDFTMDRKRNKPISCCKSCRNANGKKERKDRKIKKEENQIVLNNQKICSKCNKIKDLSQYLKRSPTLLRAQCRDCINERQRETMKIRKENPNWQLQQREKRLLKKDEKKLYDKERRKTLPPGYRKEINKRYWVKLKQDKERLKRTRDNHKKHKKLNHNLRLSHRLRERIRRALNSRKLQKSNQTQTLLGASVSDVLQYIESKFKAGMSWENKHLWHIDHVIAVSRFDLTKVEEQLKAFHYTNLQPLWSEENLEKNCSNNWISLYEEDDNQLLGISILLS